MSTLLAVLLVALLVWPAAGMPLPTYQDAPAAPAAPAPTPKEEITSRQEAVATELAEVRARLEGLPADASADVRAVLSREIEKLERISLVLSQRLAAIQRADELRTQLEELKGDLERLRVEGPVELPPYSLLLLDSLRDELETEQGRGDAVEAAVRATATAVTDARQQAEEKESARRRAREAEETNSDEGRRAELARAHRMAVLESRLAARTLELREAEQARELIAQEVHERRVEILTERIQWIERDVQFTREDLQTRLLEIETRRTQLRQRLGFEQDNASYLEEERAEAKRQLDSEFAPAPALVAEVEAREAAVQSKREEIDALNRQIERLTEAETIWRRRFEVARGLPDRATLLEWEAETRSGLDRLNTELRLQSARSADVRVQLANLATRLEATDGAEPELVRWLRLHQQQLRNLSETLDGRTAGIDSAQRLHRRLLSDIGVETATVTWGERLGDLWTRLGAVWHFELTSVKEQPITVGKIVVGLAILFFGLLASRFLSRFLGRRILPRLRFNEGATAAVQSILFYVLVITFGLFALRAVNIPLTVFTVLGGALAIGVGFGSQNVINNFISGLILLAERPVRVGDLIQVESVYGTVEHIGARSTRIRTGENYEIIVPNSSFLEQNVVNWTLTSDRIRTSVSVGVVYGSPTREVTRLLKHAVEEHGRVLKSPQPIVVFTEFGDNSLNFEVHFWIKMKTVMDRRIIQSDLRYRIDGLFREAGIVIAFPQRDVHLDSISPVEVRLLADREEPGPDVQPES